MTLLSYGESDEVGLTISCGWS